MKKALLTVAVILLSLCLLFGCTPNEPASDPTPTAAPSENATPTVASTPTATPEPKFEDTGWQERYEAIAELTKIIGADSVAVRESLGWWDDFARFSYNNSSMDSFFMNADACGTAGGYERCGVLLSINTAEEQAKSTIKQAHDLNMKVGAYLELQGDTGTMLMGFHQKEDGTFEIDPATNQPRIYADSYSWAVSGAGRNAAVNYVRWVTPGDFFTEEPCFGDFVFSKIDKSKIYPSVMPTYPDGTPAIGFSSDEIQDPSTSLFLDANCSKNINGEYLNVAGFMTLGDNLNNAFVYENSMMQSATGNILSIGKDSASPFWKDYTAKMAEYFVSLGVDYFWFDNWCGWDNIHTKPLDRGFGTWSDYKFKEYLKQYPEIGVTDPDNFSITEYVREKGIEGDTYMEDHGFLMQDSYWREEFWLDDPIWMAYLSFKAKSNIEYSSAIFKAIKDASLKYNGDAEAVAICANDFPYPTYSAYDGNTLDLIHTEYNCTYSACTGFATAGYPPNGYSGHAFSLISDSTRSKNANVWYYTEDYRDKYNLGLVFNYEALAYNVTVYNGDDCENMVGTDKNATHVNESIGKLRDKFSDRGAYAEIGVLFSEDSETSTLAPGGFIDSQGNETTLSYMGWCHALNELNVPYRAINHNKLADRINLVSVLIMPNVRSISQKEVDELIIPFLDNGGTIVVTGEDAGKVDIMENNYAKHDKCLLVDLAESYSGNGNVIYFEQDPTIDYFKRHKNSDIETIRELYLNDIEAIVNDIFDKGYAHRLVTFENLPDSVETTLNYSPMENNYFLDIVNMQIDVESDTVTPISDGVVAKLRLPSQLWGKTLVVEQFTADKNKFIELENGVDYTIENEYITVNLKGFNVYSTLIITWAGK